MGESPGHHRVVSLHLARTLDEIGLNTLTVKNRRHAYLCDEFLENVYSRLTVPDHMNTPCYRFGSQTEGSTTPGMASDVDTLYCIDIWNVIEDLADWTFGKHNLLMLQGDTAPGYCHLQRLRADAPMALYEVPDENFTLDNFGRVILKNTFIHSKSENPFVEHDRNGPASSVRGRFGVLDSDTVVALPCRKWPGQAAEFARRRRRYGWPSPRLLEEATSHGVFLVPVGYKLSPTEPLEWRISASMAERCLMFSLSIVHIKAYVLLKILVKTFVAPRIKDSISSYHCKTALLHCTENTEPEFWHEDNLLLCVTRCLEFLRNWVADLFCPHFMISRENLFAGKVTARNRDMLKSILTELIRSDGRALLRVEMDNFGHMLQTRINAETSRVPIVYSHASVAVTGFFERNKHRMISGSVAKLIFNEENKANKTLMIKSVNKKICLLKGSVDRAHKHERQALQTSIRFLSCWLGSLLASPALAHKRRVPRQAIQLMSTTAKYDVASMLKLASIFYCSEKYGKAETILQKVEDHFRENEWCVLCVCNDKPTRKSPKVCHALYAVKGKTACAKLFTHCVRFSPSEIHCAPPALRHELSRAIDDDIQHRNPVKDWWMALGTVDCLPYLFYLQYLTHKKLGKHDMRKRSLDNLDDCVRDGHDFGHMETAWNLLGQCHEEEQDTDQAMFVYSVSLDFREKNNAANWHVQNLRYRGIRKGCLPSLND